jgi:hypothetical protein
VEILRDVTAAVRLAVAGTLMGMKARYLHILKTLDKTYDANEISNLRKARRAGTVFERGE